MGGMDIRGCVACGGLAVGSPVYYASANAALITLLARLFCSTPFDKTMKVGAGVAAARRGRLIPPGILHRSPTAAASG